MDNTELHHVTLRGAWELWRQGPAHIETTVLWGLRLFWWARIGKLLEGISGAMILAEIIGSERIRAFGKNLHGAFTIAKARAIFTDAKQWSIQMIVANFFETDEANEAAVGWSTYRTSRYNYIVSLVLGIIMFKTIFQHEFRLPLAILCSLGSAAACLTTIGPIITIALIIGSLTIGFVFDAVVIEPIAWTLDRPKLEKGIKLLTLFLLLVGFHFDFLTS